MAVTGKIARRCCSDLPLDLLCVILRRLSFRDFIISGAVSRSWRSAMKQIHLPPPPQQPWLLIQTGTLFSPAEKILFRFGCLSGDQRCIGTSYGWLIIVDEKSEIFLLDPLTNARHQLPSFAKTPGIDHNKYLTVNKAFLVSGDHPHSSALRNGNYTVAVTYGDHCCLAYVRSGDETWILLDNTSEYINDIVYHGGLFYVIDIIEQVWGWDFTGDAPLLVKDLGWEHRRRHGIRSSYLMEALGGLLQVLRVGAEFDRFVILKLDQDRLKWVEIESLGDISLLMCSGGSMSFSTQEFPELKGNCVYFFDPCHCIYYFKTYNCCSDGIFYRDLEVYNFQDESVGTCYSNVARVNWPPEISNDA